MREEGQVRSGCVRGWGGRLRGDRPGRQVSLRQAQGRLSEGAGITGRGQGVAVGASGQEFERRRRGDWRKLRVRSRGARASRRGGTG